MQKVSWLLMCVDLFYALHKLCHFCSILQVLRVTAPSSVTYELGKTFLCRVVSNSCNKFIFTLHISLTSLPVCYTFDFTPSLDRTRPDQLSDDIQRRYAEDVQALQAAEVAKQLEDFR